MNNKLILLITICITGLHSFAQDTWKWGNNEKEAKGNYMYMKTLVDAEKYSEAAVPCQWLLINAPNLDVALYQLAGTIYQNKVKNEKDKTKESVLKDSLIYIYDKRMELFGNEAYVLNLKGLIAWPHYYKDKTKQEAMYAMYKKTYELNGKETSEPNLLFYFAAATRQFDTKKMSESDLLNLYAALSSDLESRNNKSATAYKDKLDEELTKHITVDCDFVQKNYGAKFNSTPDTDLAKKIQSLLEKNKCISNDLYIAATNFLIEKEGSSYHNLKTLGNIYNNQGKTEEAYNSYTKSLELTEVNTEKADLHMKIASIDIQKGRKPAARNHIYKAIELDNALYAEGHKIIGDLYMTSGSDCAKGDPLEDRLIYIAAYSEYKKAGNTSKMTSAKAQFPSMEDIFVHNKKVGDALNTGCWIGETVALDKRD